VTDHRVFNIPEFHGQQREVTLVWRLQKHSRYAECRLFTHPIGAEIRLEAGGEFVRSEANRDPMVLMDLASEWRSGFIQKGWA
jgi:hypothetical protein